MKPATLSPYPQSQQILQHNRKFIPGGVVSVNRATQPELTFVRAEGASMWDADGNRYIDYHAAFAPYFLGHNDPDVTDAVLQAIDSKTSLFGSGTTVLEGELAEAFCDCVPTADSVQLMNTGSEATAQAIRLARAATGRDHIIVVQGSYNGWHNDVSCNVMTPLSVLGERRSPGEYPYLSMSAGVPVAHQQLIHIVNFNDLDSVRYVCERYSIAAMITEPILQNIGIVKPQPAYLEGLRELADTYGFVLIFDEVKTGFRHAPGGYAQISGVTPDLATYGKAIANGYPMAAVAGKSELMNLFVDKDNTRRVLLAGTYNAHPVATAAAIATIRKLGREHGEVYRHVDRLGEQMERGLQAIIRDIGITAVVARQGSAFCIYFMDHLPVDWHDVAANHRFDRDSELRQKLIERGIYFFPAAAKQCSISYAHTEEDIRMTLECVRESLREMAS